MLEQLVAQNQHHARIAQSRPKVCAEKKMVGSQLCNIVRILKDNFPQYPVFSFVFIEVSIELL